MSVLTAFGKELRVRRLWPVVAVLLVAIAAVPLVLAKSPAPASVQPPPTSGLPTSGSPASPSISAATPNATPPSGPAHNPFAAAASAVGQSGGSPSTGSGAAAGTNTSGTAPGGSSSGGGSTPGAAPSGPSSGAGTGSSAVPTPTTPTTPSSTPPEPAPTGLTEKEAYRVTLAITNSSGGLNTIDSLERLSILPSQRHPLLVDIGVLRGGRRVLFAVQPGAIVSGPGSCTPGPIDCQVLSLAPGQTENLSSANGAVARVLFAVTAVTTDQYPSEAAAEKARLMASADGHRLLSDSTSSALSLFPYDPALGAVVDLRNLSVGG